MLSILKKAHFWALFTNKKFSIHKIKKMRHQKLPIGDPSDRKFISQNIPVIPDNPTEPITNKALLAARLSFQVKNIFAGNSNPLSSSRVTAF